MTKRHKETPEEKYKRYKGAIEYNLKQYEEHLRKASAWFGCRAHYINDYYKKASEDMRQIKINQHNIKRLKEIDALKGSDLIKALESFFNEKYEPQISLEKPQEFLSNEMILGFLEKRLKLDELYIVQQILEKAKEREKEHFNVPSCYQF